MSSATAVKVSAGFRAHLGFYRFLDPPYAYGSLGVALDKPSFQLIMSLSDSDKVDVIGPTDESRQVVKEVIMRLAPGFRGEIRIDGLVMHHVGLGTRTRLILATLRALAELGFLKHPLQKYASDLGVGYVSTVGIYTFLYGGLVIDSGKLINSGENTEPIFTSPLPQSWRILLALPTKPRGLTEREEAGIMKFPTRYSKQMELYEAVTKLMSSVKLRDFEGFVNSVEKIQKHTGTYFSEFQGGQYCCEESDMISKVIAEAGARGIGQSSWGPLVYGFLPNPGKCEEIKEKVVGRIEDYGIEIKAWCSGIPAAGHYVEALRTEGRH